jgi:glycosyltransferase involved in cell wall biosynthesis
LWTKGILSLANAAKLLLEDPEVRNLDPLFVLVGDGDDKEELQRSIALFGLEESFRLVGRQPYSELPAIHRLADVFVLPSISTKTIQEQFGIALIESMASGKPVVSTYCGAIEEVVGDAGLLVQPNDYLSLAESLRSLCLDEDFRLELGQLAISRVQQGFSSTSVSDKLAMAYLGTLKS